MEVEKYIATTLNSEREFKQLNIIGNFFLPACLLLILLRAGSFSFLYANNSSVS